MPIPLALTDFKMTQATCEVRYEDAYLIYDRTGHVFHEIRGSFTDLKVINASPPQTSFRCDEGTFALEVGQCRFRSQKGDTKREVYAGQCKRFFDSVVGNLDIKVFTRIGLRVLFRKDFDDLQHAETALNSLQLANLGPPERFGIASNPEEVLFRWQNQQLGTTLRFKAESGKIEIVLPPELEADKPEIQKSFNGLVIDIDYYTVAPVERSQWDASAWIPQSLRTIKKHTDAILSR